MPGLQEHMCWMKVTVSRRQYGKFPFAGGREEQLQRKIHWGSLFCERDEANQEYINTKTLTNKKDQEGVWHIKKDKDFQLRQTPIQNLALLLNRCPLLVMFYFNLF